MDLVDEAMARLVSYSTVNLNAEAQTTLFTVPVGKKAYITKIVLRDVSVALDTVSISFGWNTGVATDVVSATGALTVAQNGYHEMSINSDCVRGNAGNTLEIDVATAEGDASTGVVDVFGYLVDA
jgi:hypothetical protein